MIEIHKPVLVHSCRIQMAPALLENLNREERYVEVRTTRIIKDLGSPRKLGEDFQITEREIEEISYLKLPKTCRCRKYISYYDADTAVANGKAMRIFKLLARGVVKDEKRVWMPIVRERVPRVDLISRPDIERAYVGSDRKSPFYVYNRDLKRFIRIQNPPEGMSKAEWLEKMKEEVNFERRIRRQYSDYIENVHKMHMDFRSKLIVPFKPDPFEGRCLFFVSNQRTEGGQG